MSTNTDSLLQAIAYLGGGSGLGLFVKYAAQGIRTWGKRRQDEHVEHRTDEVAASAILREALVVERDENEKLRERCHVLEGEKEELRDQLFDQRRVYEAEIEDLKSKIAEHIRALTDVTAQLEILQRRVAGTTPA